MPWSAGPTPRPRGADGGTRIGRRYGAALTYDRSDVLATGTGRLLISFRAFLCFALASPARADEPRGRVVGISDGDTMTLLTPDPQQFRVRLAEIHTPERRQLYGRRARQDLSELVFQRQVRVEVVDEDRYNRFVGRVHAGPVDVNARPVERGAARV